MSEYSVKQPLSYILLIDDDQATNFMHRLIIDKLQLADKIVVAKNGREALEHLKTADQLPDLIFLDINMPVMDGWQFLKAYREQFNPDLSSTIICMLTTALPDQYRERHAEEMPLIARFVEKPLTRLLLVDIIAEFYPDCLDNN